MNIISDNPFRILGLLSNSSERDLQRQLSRLKAYANVGKSTSLDYDFNFLGDCKRDLQNISEAASKIEQAKNKVHFGLFWFIDNNQFDEIALTHLKENNHSKASEVWNKVIKGKEITPKNFSNALNLSSLSLSLNTCNGRFNLEEFVESIRLKGEIITSDLFPDFVSLIAGEVVSINKEIAIKGFIDEVINLIKPKLDVTNGISLIQFIKAFNSFPHEIRQYVNSKFTDRPISSIENHIAEAKNLRDEFPAEAGECGEKLIQKTKGDLQFLKNILPENNLQLQIVSNKLANELLQCAIDYFNYMQDDDEIDPVETCLKLARHAYAISTPGQIKDRIEENLESLEDWIVEKPVRDRQKFVKSEIEFLAKLMNRLNQSDDVPTKINGEEKHYLEWMSPLLNPDPMEGMLEIVNKGKEKLKALKRKLGKDDELYVNISSAFCHSVINKIVDQINKTMNEVSKHRINQFNMFDPLILRTKAMLENSIRTAIQVMFIVHSLDMVEQVKKQFVTNFSSLSRLANQIGVNVVDPQKELEKRINLAKQEFANLGYSNEISTKIELAETEMRSIKKWRFFKNKEKNDKEIMVQQKVIDKLLKEADEEKQKKAIEIKLRIAKLELEQREYFV